MSNKLISVKRMFSQWVAPNTKPVVPHPLHGILDPWR